MSATTTTYQVLRRCIAVRLFIAGETRECECVTPAGDIGRNTSCVRCERINFILLMELPRNNLSRCEMLRIAFHMQIACVAYNL